MMSFPAEIPAAHAPRIRKRDLYHDASVFNDLDEYVFQVGCLKLETLQDIFKFEFTMCKHGSYNFKHIMVVEDGEL